MLIASVFFGLFNGINMFAFMGAEVSFVWISIFGSDSNTLVSFALPVSDFSNPDPACSRPIWHVFV